MQVTSKDSKHLFSLDNLLDFLHKKADITDCLKQHRSLWRIHDTCFIMKMKWGRKNTCGNGTERNKDCDKETRKRENWRNITVWAFLLKWITLYFLLVYWVHQWYPCATNLYLVIRVTGQQTLKRQFARVFFCTFFNSTGVYRGRCWMCVTRMSWIKEGVGVISV